MNHEAFEHILNRESGRMFFPHPVPAETRERLLKAAVEAPKTTVLHAYSIIVVNDLQQRMDLHRACGYPTNTKSPLLVVFCIDVYRLKYIMEEEEPELDFNWGGPDIFILAICDAIVAAQSMAETANNSGLASAYSSAVLNNAGSVREILALPEYVFPIIMLRLGYPASPAQPQPLLINPIHNDRYVYPGKEQHAKYKKLFQHLFRGTSIQSLEVRTALDNSAVSVWHELTRSGFFQHIENKKEVPPGVQFETGKTLQIIRQARRISRKRKGYTLRLSFLYSMARFYLVRKQPERALDCFSKSILIAPDAAELYCCLGVVHRHLGDLRRSLHYFQKAVGLEKEEPYFYLWLGETQLLRKEEDAALNSLDMALKLNSALFEAWLMKARLLDRQKVWEGALYCYHKMESLRHQDHSLYNNMALVYLRLGKLQEARKYCGKALDLRPRDPIVLANIGLIFTKMGEFKKASACYTKALRSQPDNVALLNNKGYCLLKTGRYQEALAIYELALELKPGLLSALENKASCLTLLGRTDDALQCYNEILRQIPQGSTALNNKALCLAKMGKDKQALCCHLQALEKDPDNVSFLSNTAACLIRLERYSEALEHYERALKLYPEEPSLLSGKGVCLDYMGRFDEAVNCYNHALRLA